LPSGDKFVSRENVQITLAIVMVISLAVIIVTLPLALIWIRQLVGTVAAVTADTFAAIFGLAFLMALILVGIGQRKSVAQGRVEAGKCSVGRTYQSGPN